MSDDALIRRKNLRALGYTAQQLADRVGSGYSYWKELLRNDHKSFGEKTARRIEDAFDMPRGSLDDADLAKSIRKRGLTPSATNTYMDDDASLKQERIPLKMAYSPTNLSSTIVLLGSLLGALDQRSRRMIGMLLNDLAESPDDAQDVAAKASALATTQKAVTRNKALSRAITSNKDLFETGPVRLEEE